MGNKRIIVKGIFKTVTPLCTISTIKEGYVGFILDSSFVIYTKKRTENQYIRIRKDAKIFEEEFETNMLGVDQEEGIITIHPISGSYFYVSDEFDDDGTLYTEEFEIQHEEACFFGDFEVVGKQDAIEEILSRCETLQERHEGFINYCYQIESEEKGMQKFAETVQLEMIKAFPNMTLPALRMFEDEISTESDILQEKIATIKKKTRDSEDDEIPNFSILGNYFDAVIKLVEDCINQKENGFPEKKLSRLGINELIELFDKAIDEKNKELIKREIDEKIKKIK